MISLIVKSFLIGVCASVPVGPACITIIQKSLGYGHKVGFTAALGSATSDTFYAALSMMTLAAIQDFIMDNAAVISLIGGIVIAVMGVLMALSDPYKGTARRSNSAKHYVQTLLTALANPGSLAFMLAFCAFFKMKDVPADWTIIFLILAVFAGAALYWFFFTWFFSHWKKVIKISVLKWINRVAGVTVAVLGIILFAKGINVLI